MHLGFMMCNCAQKPNDENSKTVARSPLSGAAASARAPWRQLASGDGGAAPRRPTRHITGGFASHLLGGCNARPDAALHASGTPHAAPPLWCRRRRHRPPPGLLRGQRTQIITTTGRQGLPAKSSEVPYFVTIAWYVVSMPIMDGNNPFQSGLKRFVFMQDFLDN